MSTLEEETHRAEALLRLGEHARRHGLRRLSDDAFLHLLAEQRWALARLASPALPLELRSVLNAASLRVHGVMQQGLRPAVAALRHDVPGLGRSVLLAAAVFFGSGALTLTAVLADPTLSLALVPRELLVQLDGQAWGARGGVLADLGMTLFYWGNNLRASFLALSLGLLGGVPALLVLAFNGMLLGAVAGAAVHHGVLGRLLAWVAPHGVPEVGALILCGAIGWRLGMSFLRPGALRRRDALARAGATLLPLTALAAALVICAAPLEGFVAPLELPRWLDGGLAIGWVIVLGGAARYAVTRTPTTPRGEPP